MEAGKEEVGHVHHNKNQNIKHEYDATSSSSASSSSSSSEEEVSFWHDFVAGGVAGSASVVVGHPFDTIKVSRSVSLSQLMWFKGHLIVEKLTALIPCLYHLLSVLTIFFAILVK